MFALQRDMPVTVASLVGLWLMIVAADGGPVQQHSAGMPPTPPPTTPLKPERRQALTIDAVLLVVSQAGAIPITSSAPGLRQYPCRVGSQRGIINTTPAGEPPHTHQIRHFAPVIPWWFLDGAITSWLTGFRSLDVKLARWVLESCRPGRPLLSTPAGATWLWSCFGCISTASPTLPHARPSTATPFVAGGAGLAGLAAASRSRPSLRGYARSRSGESPSRARPGWK